MFETIFKGEYNVSRRSPSEVYSRSFDFGKKTGCIPSTFFSNSTSTPSQTILNCLINQNAKTLISKQTDDVKWFPTTEFAPQNQNLNVDVLIGFNQNEGTTFVLEEFDGTYMSRSEQYLNNLPNDTNIYDNNFALSRIAEFHPELKRQYWQCVSNLYSYGRTSFPNDFTNGTIDYNLNSAFNRAQNSRMLAWLKVSKITGDVDYNCASIDFASRLKTTGKVYQYNFNKITTFSTNPKWLGVTHG
jgi:carboxylesterase type B